MSTALDLDATPQDSTLKADEEGVQNVLDRLRREECSVSVTTLSTEPGISRARAAQWLRDAVLHDTSAAISSVTYCQVTPSVSDSDIPCTTFQLVTQPVETKKESLSTASIVAVTSSDAGNPQDWLQVAHERDLATWRDAVQRQIPIAMHDDDCGIIRPARPIQDAWRQAPVSVALPRSAAPVSAGVVTTAAQFFGQTKKASEDGKENHKAVGGRRAASSTTTTKLEKNRTVNGGTKAAVVPKPAVVTEKTAPKHVGSVDDFMGDMDDEDDDDEMMMEEEEEAKVPQPKPVPEVPPPTQGSTPTKQRSSPAAKKIAASPQSGAMDAFVHALPEPTSQRRRKVLVEQTTVDEKGYLRTVQTEVWQEDAAPEASRTEPSRPVATRPPKKTTKSQSHLKQGSLKGFFAKK